MRITMLVAALAVAGGEAVTAEGEPAKTPVRLEAAGDGGFLCRTEAYEARVGAEGGLLSLRAGGTEFLGPVSAKGPAAGILHAGQFVPLKVLEQRGPDTLVAHGDPKDPAHAVAGSPCPYNARVTYRFLADRLEIVLEQSMDQYGAFGWAPSGSVTASRDALTDYPIRPGGPAPYGQTDPRWTTREGPVLRFDFGVWQKGFANANWGQCSAVGPEAPQGKAVPVLQSTVPAGGPITAKVFPLASPGPGDALTFDISAADPDFLQPGGKPVHFDIKVTNTGPRPLSTRVRFEARDYLTQKPVAAKSTELPLGSHEEKPLPTDIALAEPGPYRAAIVIEEGGKVLRSFWWVFTYDFAHYSPPTTRPADFEEFWKQTLAESAATPLDPRLTPVPEKSTPAVEALKVSFATLGGRRIYGWYARPKAPGKYPAHLRFPSSGIYPLPGPEIYPDRCSLWIQIHGFDVDLSNMPAGDDPGKGYWTAGIASPKTSMWRTIYTSLVRAVDFMLAQPQVDPGRVAVTGGSQGGGLAMVAASLDHRIGFCNPYHSGLPRLDWTVKHAPGYWPFGMDAKPKDQTEEEFLKTLSYFDPANFTQDVRCPIAAEVGLMDTVTASGNQICALAHVRRGLLTLVCSPWAMHGGGSRAGNPIGERYARFLRGEKG